MALRVESQRSPPILGNVPLVEADARAVVEAVLVTVTLVNYVHRQDDVSVGQGRFVFAMTMKTLVRLSFHSSLSRPFLVSCAVWQGLQDFVVASMGALQGSWDLD